MVGEDRYSFKNKDEELARKIREMRERRYPSVYKRKMRKKGKKK